MHMTTVASLLRWRAGQQANQTAVICEGRETTYAELDQRSSRVANALIAVGLQPGQRVCVLDKGHDGVFEAIFGIAKAGGVYAPVNWRLAAPEIAFVLNDAEAPLVFVGDEFAATVSSVESDLKKRPTIVRWGDGPERWPSYAAFVAGSDESDPHRETAPDQTAWQLYTSGTTGDPKGAELTHHNLMTQSSIGMVGFGGARVGDVALVCMPLYHVGGSGYALCMMFAGCSLVVLREPRPDWILGAIERHGVQHAFFVPALLNSLVQHPQCTETDLSCLCDVMYAASPIPEDLLIQAMQKFGCKFFQAYGLTETTGATVTLGAEEHYVGNPRLSSCGKPVLGVDLRIVNGDGRPCAPGVVGEIEMRGDLVMRGYYNQPEATAQAFRDGWFRSGDAGYLDEDGFLYIHDRVKDMIVLGGEDVYPAEVESAIFAHPDVIDVAVIGVPDDRWGEAVKAVAVLRVGSSTGERELIQFCRDKIAGFKCPKSVDFVEELPRNPTGKILKRDLRERYWKGRDRRVN